MGYIAENRLTELSASADWSELDILAEEGWQLLDVRTTEEYAEGAIPGAVNIPVDDLRGRIGELSGHDWIVYCAVGQRAHVATQLLAAHGVTAKNLDGGWSTWRNTAAGQRENHQRPTPALAVAETAESRA